MKIRFVKHKNKNKANQVEFWLINFDFIDGSDLLAKLFCKEYGMQADEKIDGFWFTIIKLHSEDSEYDLLWHEDMGNIVCSTKQDEESLLVLEQRLCIMVEKLNQMLKRQSE